MQTTNNAIIDILLCLALVFGPMAVVVATYVGSKRNERMNMRIGLEIEAIKKAHIRESPHEKMAVWITKRDKLVRSLMSNRTRANTHPIVVNYMGYTHEVVGDTKIVTDSSLNHGGFEIVSPPLKGRGNIMSWISRITSHLRGVANADRSCGLHVHVGLRDYGSQCDPRELGFADGIQDNQHPSEYGKAIVGRVGYAYGHFQQVFNLMVSPSRRNGEWSRDVSYMTRAFPNPKQIKEIDLDNDYNPIERQITDPLRIGLAMYGRLNEGTEYGDRRYQCVNPTSYPKYGTIEFRSHQGTVNEAKIQNWVQLLHLLVSRCASPLWSDITEYNGNSINDLFAWLGIANDDPLFVATVRRIKALNGDNPSVFRHDPILAHNALFKESVICSGCGSTTCDHDEQCGTNYTRDLRDETEDHFFGLSRKCQSCNMELRHTNEGRRYDQGDYHEAFCDSCGGHRNFYGFAGLALSIALGTIPLALVVVGCGIGAIHAVANKYRHKRITAKLFKALAVRGRQASGFAFENGKGVYYVKQPQPSTAMAHHISKQIKSKTLWSMLHTRFATHGDNNKANAHPHFGGKGVVTMVHNGVVHNHDSVWEALKREPTGPVDSQAVAECLFVGGIEKVVEHCQGSMSLIWSDSRDPTGTLKCWTNGGNPLVMGRLDNGSTGAVVIASTEAILRQACGKRLKTVWDATIGREYTITPNGSITKRDIEGSEATAGVTYDWRTYANWYSTGNYSVTTTKPKHVPYRVRQMAKKGLELTGSWDVIDNKWDGFDLATYTGVHATKRDKDGRRLQYELPQYINPMHYDSDMEEILRGKHRPENTDTMCYYG